MYFTGIAGTGGGPGGGGVKSSGRGAGRTAARGAGGGGGGGFGRNRNGFRSASASSSCSACSRSSRRSTTGTSGGGPPTRPARLDDPGASSAVRLTPGQIQKPTTAAAAIPPASIIWRRDQPIMARSSGSTSTAAVSN